MEFCPFEGIILSEMSNREKKKKKTFDLSYIIIGLP